MLNHFQDYSNLMKNPVSLNFIDSALAQEYVIHICAYSVIGTVDWMSCESFLAVLDVYTDLCTKCHVPLVI